MSIIIKMFSLDVNRMKFSFTGSSSLLSFQGKFSPSLPASKIVIKHVIVKFDLN